MPGECARSGDSERPAPGPEHESATMAWVRRGSCIGLAWLASISSLAASGFTPCEEALRADGYARSGAECFWKVGSIPGRHREALRRLEDARRRNPGSGWIAFYIAELLAAGRAADSVVHYRSAVESFVLRSDPAGEAEARLRLSEVLFSSGQREEAWDEASRALAAAKRSGDQLLTARAMLQEGDLAQDTGERLGRGLGLLIEARELVFPDGPYALQRRVLGGLGKLAFDLGRYEAAQSFYDALVRLARDNGDSGLVVHGAYAALTARRKQMEELPEPDRLPELTTAARELAGLADRTGEPRLQSMAHRTLGDLLWPMPDARREAEAHFRTALMHARQAGEPFELTMALWALGRVLADRRPDESQRLVGEALARAVDSGNANVAAYAWRQHMRLAWKMMPRTRAGEASIRALDAIEGQRMLQGPGAARAEVLAGWTPDYYWLTGALLDVSSPTREELSLAFEVGERMRARLLLDALLRPSEPHPAVEAPPFAARQQLLREISAVQRQLLDPRLQGAARASAVARLERLEREEEGIRADLAAARDVYGAEAPAVITLDRVEHALRADEALLTFSVGVGQNFYGEFAGGAWLLVTTNAGTRAIGLPDRPKLSAMVSVYRGLVEQDGPQGGRAGAALHDVLLEEALQSLPGAIRRFIVVPDGPLHHLPFAALRSGPNALPLGSTHEIVMTPSASVWVRLRAQSDRVAPGAALVLADPAFPDAVPGTSQERGWSAGLPLSRLPYARAEGQSIVSRLGGASRLLDGADATETAITSGELHPFGILHFAAHALVDEAQPDRSALLLAGDSEHDGLLQSREIADLPLAGRIVVLSACRTATGAVVAGEGVMGLSRSFFEAGARTVIGTLWPIRDDHAALFFEPFYAAMRGGGSVSDAMLDARRTAIARGLPASTWSSFVVIGDDAAIGVPEARRRHWLPAVVIGVAATIVLGVIGVARRRSRRTSASRAAWRPRR